MDKLIGKHLTTDIEIAGVKARCILDTGSQVTTICADFVHKYLKGMEHSRDDIIWLSLKAANGISIPYSGYLQTGVTTLGARIPGAGILVVEGEAAPDVPCLLGMNVLKHVQKQLFSAKGQNYLHHFNSSEEYQQLFQMIEERQPQSFSTKDGRVGFVRMASRSPVIKPALQVILTGRVS
ncbi:hypothetical protein HOLleu_42729 [Holothuria leucospilota]|uniref:Uncharacterized protein n=1 Tax=Holothuria leucospilota TaxID=206669 RepID=A0A9Q1BC07_HOLLE|nr:hypothetical protein HOLleu_42729 [Holothuria leucospilota]